MIAQSQSQLRIGGEDGAKWFSGGLLRLVIDGKPDGIAASSIWSRGAGLIASGGLASGGGFGGVRAGDGDEHGALVGFTDGVVAVSYTHLTLPTTSRV